SARRGDRQGRNRADLRRLPAPRVAAEHVAVEPQYLLVDPEPGRQCLYEGHAAGSPPPPRPDPGATAFGRLSGRTGRLTRDPFSPNGFGPGASRASPGGSRFFAG